MHLGPRSYPRTTSCLIAVAFALLDTLPARSHQAQQIEWNIQTPNDARVLISNASLVSIISWEKDEVSIRAEVLSTMIQKEEVRVKPANNKIEVSCSPARPARKLFLTLRVPTKAQISVETNGNSVQITQPADQIVVSYASRELIQLSVPESAALDMKEARSAVERRQLGILGNARIGISGQRVGTGPPFVKVSASKALVVVARGMVEPPQRPPTLAATAIARRSGTMGEALKRTAPHLIRPSSRLDPPSPVKRPAQQDEAVRLETYLVNLNISIHALRYRRGFCILQPKRRTFQL